MMSEFDEYDAFVTDLKTKFPEMFDDANGEISISKGWYPIVSALCGLIYWHYDWIQKRRIRLLENNPHDEIIPDAVEFPKIQQVKEKFGGLRFYLDGADDYTDGAISMAESWAARTCEQCGAPGQRRSGGWIRTLCDTHEAERQEQIAKRNAGV
jgi:hypothetical protein